MPSSAPREQYARGLVQSPHGEIGILCSESGIVVLSLPGHSLEEIAGRTVRPGFVESGRSGAARRLVERTRGELSAYFSGRLREFSVPLDLRGTAFQQTVWREVAAVPYGETVAYRDVARRIGRPNASRAVGHANGANPIPIIVPCHRIVGSDGGLTGYGGGLEMKRALLDHEREHLLPA